MASMSHARAVGRRGRSRVAGSESADSPAPCARTRRPRSRVFTAFFGVFGWAVGLSKLSDNSFFWHLRTGEYILDHGIPHHDVFSYTAPGTKWVAQSWLAEVLYAALYRTFGGIGIRLFVGARGRRHRHPHLPPGAPPGARPDGRLRAHRRRAGGHLHGVVGTAAADRRAVPPRPAVGGRGARQHRRPSPARRRSPC